MLSLTRLPFLCRCAACLQLCVASRWDPGSRVREDMVQDKEVSVRSRGCSAWAGGLRRYLRLAPRAEARHWVAWGAGIF